VGWLFGGLAAAHTPGHLTVNWAILIPVGIALFGFCLAGLRFSLGSKDRLQTRYETRRRAARTRIQGEEIVPGLAKLMANAFGNDAESLLAQLNDGDLAYQLEGVLAESEFLPSLKGLSRLYADYSRLSALQAQATSYDRRQIPGFIVLLVSGAYWAVNLSLSHTPLPQWFMFIAGGLSFAAVIVILLFGGLSLSACDALADLLNKYE
jgi:hypothetical protein